MHTKRNFSSIPGIDGKRDASTSSRTMMGPLKSDLRDYTLIEELSPYKSRGEGSLVPPNNFTEQNYISLATFLFFEKSTITIVEHIQNQPAEEVMDFIIAIYLKPQQAGMTLKYFKAK